MASLFPLSDAIPVALYIISDTADVREGAKYYCTQLTN